MKREVVWTGDRGEGSVFFRLDAEGKRVSSKLYVAYRAGGKEHVKSAATTDAELAKRRLKRWTRNRDNAKEGKEPLITPKAEKVTVGELLDANLARARAKGLEDIGTYEYRTEMLRRLLGHVRAVEYRPEHTDQYAAKRKAGQGSKRGRKVTPTAVRRDLEILETAFTHAVKRRVLAFKPVIEKPGGDNVRNVEIPLDKFPKILAALRSEHVRDMVEWLLLTAMRPAAVRAFRWEWFDEKAWTLKVPAHKRGNAREFSIEGSLRRIFERRMARQVPGCPFVFHDGKGMPIRAKRLRKHFYKALTACGLPTGKAAGYCLYDTKSTATGLLLDAGLSDAEAMDFSGHKTASMLQRYRKKTAKRHGASVRKRDEYLANLGLTDISAEFADSRPN